MDDTLDTTTEAGAVAALVSQADKNVPASVLTHAGRTFVVRRDDFSIEDKTPENAAEVYPPKIIKLTTQLQTSTALAQYLHRFKDDDSIMFADVAGNKITAILDYHVRPTANALMGRDQEKGDSAEKPAGATPRHSAHRSVLSLKHSQEWATWTGKNERLMSHTDFANFLEENGVDVVQPSGGALLELCKDLQVKGSANFKSSIRMGDTVSIEYQKSDDVSTKDNIELPAEIMIVIPVYFGEPAVTMNVLLRRKIEDGALSLGFKIKRLENHKQDEFLRIAHDIETETGVEMVLGNPA